METAGAKRAIEPERALGHEFEPPPSRFSERDVALYAIATGAVDDPVDDRQLRRAYELHASGIEPLPGFFAVLALNAMLESLRRGDRAPGLNYGLERVLHAEQAVELFQPLPARGTLLHRARVAAIHDKGRHAVVVSEVHTTDEAGRAFMRSEVSSLVRGAGGFGGPRGEERADPIPADRACDASVEQRTRENQALLFRLLGDDNPLHADPRAARAFGLRTPILHGMCTLGYASRHVVDSVGGGDPSRLRRLSVRFSDVVFPGETLVTEAWRLDDDNVAFRVRVKERDKIVLSHGEARFGAVAVAVNVESDTRELAILVDAIRAHVAARPALARSVGASFQFRLRNPEFAFLIDLSGATGTVRDGVAERADCTLELEARDFFALKRGDVLGRSLYLTGALKMTGKTELASHLDFLREVGASEPSTGNVAEPTLDALVDRLRARTQRSVERASITLRVGEATWQLDVGAAAGAPSATLTLDRPALAALSVGERTVFGLHMRGAIRVIGDVAAARALDRALAESKEAAKGSG
jgi:3-hydroxyacyl-CoA dehydrogenase/3a,7a,12a-trihydroxy-5b-cholest-24-enoyl-CoA hydratase